MIGVRSPQGIRMMAASAGVNARQMIRQTMAARKRLAINPQTKAGCSRKSRGPGHRPHM
jgi:hypothetical protein